MNKQSFISFLTIRLGISLLVICSVWFVVAERSYYFALDDTSEHYLVQDARQGIKMLQQGMAISAMNTEFKQLYPDWASIPDNIRQAFDHELPVSNQTNLVLLEEKDVYMLNYVPDPGSQSIFVVHQFDKDDSVDVIPVFVLNAIIAFMLLFVAIFSIIQRVNGQLNGLTKALSKIEDTADSATNALTIREFDNIYQSIKHSYRLRAQSIRREREFSGILSHEIRQPLAKLNAYIETLDQIDEFPLDAINILQEVKRSNYELQNISNAILNLWNSQRLQTQALRPVQFITEILADNKYQGVLFAFDNQASDLFIKTNNTLFRLMVRQLLDNALQYALGQIQIDFKYNQLVIRNDLKPLASASDEYGFGLGMVMVEKICESMQWQWTKQQLPDEFVYTITFDV